MDLKRNPHAAEMCCIRCGQSLPLGDYVEGCPACRENGWPASVKVRYRQWPGALTKDTIREWLFYTGQSLLGEGDTPLVSLPGLAAELGIARLCVKNEAANPTGSHKDRMSAALVRRAGEIGARTIAIASSGNAGASIAAYAAHAGLDCVVVTMPDMSPNWRRAIEMHGAKLVCTPTPVERWSLVAERARSGAWYSATNYLDPPVGSNPIGVDAYRAVALELCVQMSDLPATDIVVPTARADLLWGIAEGFANLREAGLIASVPRLHAVEPFPRIEKVLADGDYRLPHAGRSAMVSISGATVTCQALTALRMTGGSAISADDDCVSKDQRVLARNGFYLELSSAATLSAARELAGRGADAGDKVIVCLATSHGYKEFAHFAEPIEMYEGSDRSLGSA